MSLSSIFKNIDVVFHISSSWVKIRLYTENQLPRLPGSGLKCNGTRCGVVVVWWWWCGGFITDYKTTPTKIVLNCFGLLVGLWQLCKYYVNQAVLTNIYFTEYCSTQMWI